MASVLGAVHTLFDSLAAANFPDQRRPHLYDGEELDSMTAGQVQFPPYVRLTDRGRSPVYQSDSGGIETGSFVLEVYDRSRARVEQAVKAIKWNGQVPGAQAGFDWGALSLDAPEYHRSLKRVKETLTAFALLKKVGPIPHWKCVLEYELKLEIKAAG